MASRFGNTLQVQLFGQSHAAGIGCVIEGMPAGFIPDPAALAQFMARRAPGTHTWSTTRSEADEVRIIAGLNAEGATCGAPLALLIENTNQHSGDYAELAEKPRPGHADYPAHVKWEGHNDVRGGGQFSGRLTAALCAAGGIALQYLEQRGIVVAAHLAELAGIQDEALAAIGLDATMQERLAAQIESLHDGRDFAVIDLLAGDAMKAAIAEAQAQQDSVGGIIECVACGLPVGLGEPLYDGLESLLARIVFGIGGVKGLEFGAGFAAARMRGSQHNDSWELNDGRIVPAKNDAGGNLGGLSTGAPLLMRVAIKPTSSIALPQRSVKLSNNRETELVVKGRHDPCIAPRAVPVMEAAMALAVADALVSNSHADAYNID